MQQGLINAVQPQQQPMQQAQQAQPQQPSPEQSKQQAMQIQKIVLAAQKIMYGKETSGEFRKALQGDDVVQTAAKAATSIMSILIAESNMRINPTLIIPAGILVVGDIMDFLEKAKGITHDEAQVEDAIELFVRKMMEAVAPEQKQPGMAQPNMAQQGMMQ